MKLIYIDTDRFQEPKIWHDLGSLQECNAIIDRLCFAHGYYKDCFSIEE